MMIPREVQDRLRTMVVEAVTLLCKSGLQYKSELSIDGLLGITLDKEDVFLVSFKETVKSAMSGTDESTSVDSGYTKSSHRKRKHSARDRSVSMFDNQDSDDCTMSVESHADSYEDSDSSISLYKMSPAAAMLLPKRVALGLDDHCMAPHSPAMSEDQHSEHNGAAQENVIVIKEESLSYDEYFAAQDLNIGHDVTVTSELSENKVQSHSWDVIGTLQCKDIKTEVDHDDYEPYRDITTPTKQDKPKDSIGPGQQLSRSESAPLLKDTPKQGTSNTSQKSEKRKSSSKSSSTTSEAASLTGGEFFSMFAAQYADMDTEHHDDIARLILYYPGPYVPVRNVRRKYPRYSTDLYVSSMIQMTVPKDSCSYIGELRFLPSRVKVFYKCPPSQVQTEALLKYGFTIDSYTETFHKTGGASKEEESPAYHRAIMEYSPYEEFPHIGGTPLDPPQFTT